MENIIKKMLVLTYLYTAKKSNWNHLLSIKESFYLVYLFILFIYFQFHVEVSRTENSKTLLKRSGSEEGLGSSPISECLHMHLNPHMII